MLRRDFIRTGLATGTLISAPAILRAQAAVTLTVVHASPNKHVISAGGVEPWMEKLTELVGDAVEYKYFPAGQLSNLKGLLNAVQSGVADAVPIPIGYASDKMPLNGVSTLPGLGSSARDIITAYAEAIETEPLQQEYTQNDVVPLWNMAYPPYQFVTTEAPVTTLEGFEGMVIRSAGGSMNLAIQALGASPSEMSAGDIYVAMERGTVNATLSAYSSVKGYGVDELAKAASSNGSFGTFTNVFSVAASKWEQIPSDIQNAMKEAGRWTEKHVAEVMDTDSKRLAQEFADAGVEIYEFPEDELKKINDKLAAVQTDWVDRLDQRGLPAQSVLDAYRGFISA